jgi:hypothetical protein
MTRNKPSSISSLLPIGSTSCCAFLYIIKVAIDFVWFCVYLVTSTCCASGRNVHCRCVNHFKKSLHRKKRNSARYNIFRILNFICLKSIPEMIVLSDSPCDAQTRVVVTFLAASRNSVLESCRHTHVVTPTQYKSL